MRESWFELFVLAGNFRAHFGNDLGAACWVLCPTHLEVPNPEPTGEYWKTAGDRKSLRKEPVEHLKSANDCLEGELEGSSFAVDRGKNRFLVPEPLSVILDS